MWEYVFLYPVVGICVFLICYFVWRHFDAGSYDLPDLTVFGFNRTFMWEAPNNEAVRLHGHKCPVIVDGMTGSSCYVYFDPLLKRYVKDCVIAKKDLAIWSDYSEDFVRRALVTDPELALVKWKFIWSQSTAGANGTVKNMETVLRAYPEYATLDRYQIAFMDDDQGSVNLNAINGFHSIGVESAECDLAASQIAGGIIDKMIRKYEESQQKTKV